MSKKFHVWDCVLISEGDRKGTLGIVTETGKKQVLVDTTGDGLLEKSEAFDPSILTLVPPVSLDEEGLKELCRFEKTPDELRNHLKWAKLQTEAHYQMGLCDLEAALSSILAHGGEESEDAREWYFLTFGDLSDSLGVWDYFEHLAEPDPEEPEPIMGVPSAWSLFMDIYDELEDRYEAEHADAASFEEMLGWISAYRADRTKPLAERTFTEKQKQEFLSLWDMDQVELTGTPEIRELYVKIVNELAAKDDPAALAQKAYASYGEGKAGFPQDWKASRECLLRLEEIAPSATFANTLGYLAYYGRCTDGVPDYDEAFRWFTIGAAGGVYESRYKLADLFRDGKGCPKDPEIAHRMIMELFQDNLGHFCSGEARSKFADIALRAGNLERDGVGCTPTREETYAYYLMAKAAIRMRRLAQDCYGDSTVEEHIDEGMKAVLPGSAVEEKLDRIEFDEASLPALVRYALRDGRRVALDYAWKDKEKGKLSLTLRIQDRPDAQYPSKMLVLLPEAHFCGFVERLSFKGKVRPKDAPGLRGRSGTIVFDEMGCRAPWFTTLLLYGEEKAALNGTFVLDAQELPGKKRRYAAVSFNDPDRTWNYLAGDLELAPGDTVLVPWSGQTCEGTIVRLAARRDSEMPLFQGDYRKILKKAADTGA